MSGHRHLQPEHACSETLKRHETFDINRLRKLPEIRRAPLRGSHDDCCTKQKQGAYQAQRQFWCSAPSEGGKGPILVLSQLVGHAADVVLQHPVAVVELPQRPIRRLFSVLLERFVVGLDELVGQASR